MSTEQTTRDGKALDTYEVFCKLKFLARGIGSLHSLESTLSANECYGAELLLQEIAYVVCPEERPGGAE